jgi:uncharacterized membrane protein YgcG
LCLAPPPYNSVTKPIRFNPILVIINNSPLKIKLAMQKTLKAITMVIVNSVLITGISLTAYGQRLANIQEGSVWAPANVKIDARLNEWGDTFQAENKTVDVFYTMANDDKNLYLVIKSTLPVINNKITAGGINFTINPAGKKKDKDAFVITFPIVNPANLRSMVMKRVGGGPGGAPKPMDSAAIAGMRKQAISMAKEIKLIGFKDIPDSIISIYNEYGIKAAIDYDRNGSLVYEMAVPLKYLYPPGTVRKELAYNIKLNGLNISAMFPGAGNAMAVRVGDGGGGNVAFGGGGGGFGGGGFGGGGGDFRPPPGMPSMSDMQNIISPTDFWGKYTLAKK